MIIRDCAGDTAATRSDIRSVDGYISPLAIHAACGRNRHSNWSTLRTAGVRVDCDCTALNHAVRLGGTCDRRRQTLLGGKCRLAARYSFLIVWISHMCADVVALALGHARCINGDSRTRTFYFAAIRRPVVFQSMFWIEIFR